MKCFVLRKTRELFSSFGHRQAFPRLDGFVCVSSYYIWGVYLWVLLYSLYFSFVRLSCCLSIPLVSKYQFYCYTNSTFSTDRLCYWLSKQRKMGLSEDAGHENADERFRSLCADLNIDKNTADEAWRNYETISTNYSLEVTKFWCLCNTF